MRFAIAVAGLLTLCTPTMAQEASPRFKAAANNLSHDLVTCSAYFFISSDAVERSGATDASEQYKTAAYNALELAVATGDMVGLLAETHTARLELELDSMKKRIANDYSNISILLRDYSDHCVALLNNPQGFLVKHMIDDAPAELRSVMEADFVASGVIIPR